MLIIVANDLLRRNKNLIRYLASAVIEKPRIKNRNPLLNLLINP